MTEADFAWLRRFLKRTSGLHLGPDKQFLVETRLRPVCRNAGLDSVSDLLSLLRAPGPSPLARAVVDAMTTNETSFFRDRTVFDALRTVVLPRLMANRAGSRHLRIWSAAASTGQEAYSLAMIVAGAGLWNAGWRVTILGTDISETAIGRARAGLYSQFEVQRGLPVLSMIRYFAQGDEGWRATPELRRSVEFRTFNLLDDIAPLGSFDLILCRNLLIYLDGATKAVLLDKIGHALAGDGVLCLGTSETALGLESGFTPDPVAPSMLIRSPGTTVQRRMAG